MFGPIDEHRFRPKQRRITKKSPPRRLKANPNIRTGAAPILRTLIDEIVLRAGDKRGKMSIEVYGKPSALFLLAGDAPAAADNWMITVVAEAAFTHTR